MRIKFIRRNYNKYSKIGKNRKKLQKWRKPKGRDNKMREKRFGYPKNPSVGYKSPKKESGKINGKIPLLAHNLADLAGANSNSIIILGKVGMKKKLEMIKEVKKKKMEIFNLGGKENATK